MHRLVEVYYKLGLNEEAKKSAAILGYNYGSSEWYKRSYKILNKDYSETIINKKDRDEGLIKRTIKKMLSIDD